MTTNSIFLFIILGTDFVSIFTLNARILANPLKLMSYFHAKVRGCTHRSCVILSSLSKWQPFPMAQYPYFKSTTQQIAQYYESWDCGDGIWLVYSTYVSQMKQNCSEKEIEKVFGNLSRNFLIDFFLSPVRFAPCYSFFPVVWSRCSSSSSDMQTSTTIKMFLQHF